MPHPGASISYAPFTLRPLPDGAMSQMHADPLVGVPATARADTETIFRPVTPINAIPTGWLTIASTNPALPAFGPLVGGTLIVTVAPLMLLVNPLIEEALAPAA